MTLVMAADVGTSYLMCLTLLIVAVHQLQHTLVPVLDL